MKKKILKVAVGAALMVAMFATIHVKNQNNDSDLDLASLMSIAVASGEVVLDGCHTEEGEACNNGSVTAQDCDNSQWLESDNCLYSIKA